MSCKEPVSFEVNTVICAMKSNDNQVLEDKEQKIYHLIGNFLLTFTLSDPTKKFY